MQITFSSQIVVNHRVKIQSWRELDSRAHNYSIGSNQHCLVAKDHPQQFFYLLPISPILPYVIR